MTTPQIIELDGKPAFAVIPWELWLKVRDLVEDRDDEALYDAAKARIRETFPAAVVDALLDGANPVKVFREHRRLTQRELAQAASIAPLYLSQIENGHRTGSLETLRVLAAAL